jgi:membrane fusion protein (multidrug efflux system)
MYSTVRTILITAALAALISCSRDNANHLKGEQAVAVTVTAVSMKNAVFYNRYPGNMVALKEVELRGQVSGYVTGIYFDEGKRVRKGDKLYEIDRRKYEAAYNGAQAVMKIAEDNLEKAQRDADRYTDLAGREAVARQLYDNAMTDLKNAKQQINAANSELIRTKTDYEFSVITAPFNGTIGFSLVKMGALITPGQTLLNTISSDDSMGVDFEVSETELSRFEKLAAGARPSDDSTFRLLLPDNSRYPYCGRISVIDRAVDPKTGTIRVRIIVPNNEKTLKPGMSCKVNVLNSSSGRQILVPFKAVMEQLGEYFVFVVNNNKVSQVKIQPGPRVFSEIVVLGGLEGGETIVLDGIQKLTDGSAITLTQSTDNNKK